MPLPFFVPVIAVAAAGCATAISAFGAVIAKRVSARELQAKVDDLTKGIEAYQKRLEKDRLDKVTKRELKEKVDLLEKEIRIYQEHLEKVRLEKIARNVDSSIGQKGKRDKKDYPIETNVIWLKEEKYMVSLSNEQALNQNGNVLEGREFLSDGLFRKVAVKIIRKSDRTQKELAVLQKLNHENIVKFIDCDEIETNGLGPYLYIIMELCEFNLTTFMEKRKDRYLPIETFSLISKQLLGGLEYIHRNGLIHRDIKPDNILVIQDKTFKYSDFGITKEIPDGSAAVTQTRNGIGSDGYRAPETYRDGIVRISKSVDIFSLAIVLAQLISKGKHPYGTNHHFWKTNIMCGEKLDLSIVGVGIREKKDQLIDVLTQMLSTDPEGRPSVENIRNHTFFLNETRVVSGECIICYGNAATTAFIPCGHVHVCPDCASRLDECPTCRAKIIRPMRVYPI